MPSTNFFPSADAIAGDVRHQSTSVPWSTIWNTPSVTNMGTGSGVGIETGGNQVTNRWLELWRPIILFDTSALSTGANILSAVVKFKGINPGASPPYINWGTPKVAVVSSNPASNTTLVLADYNTLGSVALSDLINFSDFTKSDWNTFTLNASGIALIVKGGITKFGLREMTYDAPNTEYVGAWPGSYKWDFIAFSLSGAYKPILTVTYNTLSVRTDAATNVGSGNATLNGTLLDDSADTPVACSFQYGLTTAYGSTTTPGTVTEGSTFSAMVTGLTPGETYHFRAKAVGNSGDTVYGDDLTFTAANYPTNVLARVSSLTHRWSPGNYSLEVVLGGLDSKFSLPIIMSRPQPAINTTPSPTPSPVDYSHTPLGTYYGAYVYQDANGYYTAYNGARYYLTPFEVNSVKWY